jgi:excisionase family DNA binding protein
VKQAVDADVLTVGEAAKLLRIGRNALYNAIGRGEVPHVRVGKSIRLSRAALMRFLESCGRSRDAKKGH